MTTPPGTKTIEQLPAATAPYNEQALIPAAVPNGFGGYVTQYLTLAAIAVELSYSAGNGLALTGAVFSIDTSITVDKTTAQTLTNKTLTSPVLATPVINGATSGTGVSTTAAASTLMQRGASGNAQANVFVPSYTSTATAAGTTTLTVASTQLQKFTGTTTQTVLLPVVSTLVIGHTFELNNQSTGAVTIESSGGNVVAVLAPGAFATVNSNSTTGTTAASWDLAQYGNAGTNVPVRVVSTAGSITAAATDTTIVTNLSSVGAVALVLPTVASRNGLPLTVADFSGNGTITITPDASNTGGIQGQANWVVSPYGNQQFTPNAALNGWIVTA